MKKVYKLLRSISGASAVEFALLAPVFLTMLFGIIEGSRMFWMKQALDEIAYSTARCMSVSSACDTVTSQQSFATGRATGYGLRIATADVILAANVTCRGQPAGNSVTVSAPFRTALGELLPMPTTVSATACFPVLG